MVTEGVDVPRLRVGVYASAAKTPLIFRQVVGRFVRTIRGRAPEPSWLFLPADPVLRNHAEQVDGELRHILKPSGGEGEFDERPERVETERSEELEYAALAADVSAQSQMSLFGGPAVVRSFAPAAPGQPVWATEGADAPDEPEPEPEGPSAFQRRKILRAKRKSLVNDLGRRDRRTHADINAWLNKRIGISRVEDATIEQLEQSVDLLLDALSGKPTALR